MSAPEEQPAAPPGADDAAQEAFSAARVDLLAVLADGLPEREYVPGLHGIVPKGGRVLMPAPEGSGKTLLALVFTAAVLEAGGSVLYLDFENGRGEMAGRLESLLDSRGAHRDHLRAAWADGVQYLDMLDLRAATRNPHGWNTAVGDPNLVVIDSSRLALAMLGLEEDSNDDYAEFTRKVLLPLSQRGVAVLTLDNTGHGMTRARGASSKAQLNTVTLEPKVITPFSAKQTGLIRITVPRDRTGELTKTFDVRLGGGVFDPPATPTPARDREVLLAVATQVLAVADGQHATTRALVAAVRRQVHRRDAHVLEALAELAADPASGIERQADKSYRLATGNAPATPNGDRAAAAPTARPATHDADQPEIPGTKPVAR